MLSRRFYLDRFQVSLPRFFLQVLVSSLSDALCEPQAMQTAAVIPSSTPHSSLPCMRKGSRVPFPRRGSTELSARPLSVAPETSQYEAKLGRRGSLDVRIESHPTSGPVYIFGTSSWKPVDPGMCGIAN